MKATLIPVDSAIWGRNVLSLSEIDPCDDLSAAEAAYIAEHRPAYVSVRLPLEDLAGIHCFERLGFSFMECQLRIAMRFKTDFDVSRYGYEYQRVTALEELEEVLQIACAAIVHDRFSIDEGIPDGFSGRRYEAYVRQSFKNEAEEVWRLFDPAQNLTIGFRTHRRTSADEVQFLLGGIHPEMKALGLGVISSQYCFNQMRRDGVKRAVTHISAINKPIFDLEVTHFGFRYKQAFAVLRKLYR
jgi:hypothetical protein